jgi:hypothetical protein
MGQNCRVPPPDAFSNLRRRNIPYQKDILRRKNRFSDVNLLSGPPVYEKTPGVFDQTGGRTIPIRARIGSRSGKLVQRSTYSARIGGRVITKKGGFGRGSRAGSAGWIGGLARIIFRTRAGPEIFPGKFRKIFPENFSKKKFWENIFEKFF